MNAKVKTPNGPEPFWLSARARRQLATCLTDDEIDSFCLDTGEVVMEKFIAVVTPRVTCLTYGVVTLVLALLSVALTFAFANATTIIATAIVSVTLAVVATLTMIREHRDNVRRAKALGRVYGLSTFKPYRRRLAQFSNRYRGYFEFSEKDL